jgi:hypothetical protein
MPTKTVATFQNGLVEFQVDYDASNRLTALRCINKSDGDMVGEATREDNGRSYSKTFLAHTTTYIPIPTGVAQRIRFDSIGHHGHFAGLSFQFRG